MRALYHDGQIPWTLTLSIRTKGSVRLQGLLRRQLKRPTLVTGQRISLGLVLMAYSLTVMAEDSLYVNKVLPLLKDRCFSCHSHAGKKSSGGLMLDSRSGLLAGGDSGAAIVPGKPTESLLIEAVKRTGLAMPPEGKGAPLNANEIALLEKWIADGAEAPEGPAGGEAPGIRRRRSGVITEEDRKWWAFQPMVSVTLPEVRETKFRGNEIDRFIQAKLEAADLAASAEASPAVLIRRVTYDLTGLPPTPLEVTEFVKAFEQSDRAYETLVDELLSRPAYGQRMARHWLDLVRYADGDGYRADDYRPFAWRYRDYVIQSLNDDKPFDRFVQEQLAGDEMFPGNPAATIATGYLRHGIYEWNARDVRGQWDTMLNDITDTTGDVFFGLGIQCARCHDHKFDPISQRDYFRLRGVCRDSAQGCAGCFGYGGGSPYREFQSLGGEGGEAQCRIGVA